MTTKNKPLLFLLLIPALMIGVVLMVAIFRREDSTAPLTAERFRQEWDTLQGNRYTIRAQIDRQIGSSAEVGRILAVRMLDSTGRLPVLVPADKQQNFEAGQRYEFHVVVRGDILLVENADKF
ncbi:MAG: hypothetical protein LBS59_01555 [Puniceicoccales bacterium]|jgi:hypothetical protein|nr:hypothetical protein [Puniceicoccales bacterium]